MRPVLDLVHDLVYNGTMEVNIHFAKTHFSKLLERVALGEEIVVAKAGKPVARLVPIAPARKPRTPGSAKGLFSITEDFDTPLSESDLEGFHS